MAKIGCACPHCTCVFDESEAIEKGGKKYCSDVCASECTVDKCVCGCQEGKCKVCS